MQKQPTIAAACPDLQMAASERPAAQTTCVQVVLNDAVPKLRWQSIKQLYSQSVATASYTLHSPEASLHVKPLQPEPCCCPELPREKCCSAAAAATNKGRHLCIRSAGIFPEQPQAVELAHCYIHDSMGWCSNGHSRADSNKCNARY